MRAKESSCPNLLQHLSITSLSTSPKPPAPQSRTPLDDRHPRRLWRPMTPDPRARRTPIRSKSRHAPNLAHARANWFETVHVFAAVSDGKTGGVSNRIVVGNARTSARSIDHRGFAGRGVAIVPAGRGDLSSRSAGVELVMRGVVDLHAVRTKLVFEWWSPVPTARQKCAFAPRTQSRHRLVRSS